MLINVLQWTFIGQTPITKNYPVSYVNNVQVEKCWYIQNSRVAARTRIQFCLGCSWKQEDIVKVKVNRFLKKIQSHPRPIRSHGQKP